jgi:hypothetical protein
MQCYVKRIFFLQILNALGFIAQNATPLGRCVYESGFEIEMAKKCLADMRLANYSLLLASDLHLLYLVTPPHESLPDLKTLPWSRYLTMVRIIVYINRA